MYTEIKELRYQAEAEYLQKAGINILYKNTTSLAKRLETYESLRDQEIDIFQPIADKLLEAFPHEHQKTLERILKYWLSVLRYTSWAMLLDNPEFLQRRLLEWLTDIVQAHQMESVDNVLYQLLESRLQKVLPKNQFTLVQPFLEQVQQNLLKSTAIA